MMGFVWIPHAETFEGGPLDHSAGSPLPRAHKHLPSTDGVAQFWSTKAMLALPQQVIHSYSMSVSGNFQEHKIHILGETNCPSILSTAGTTGEVCSADHMSLVIPSLHLPYSLRIRTCILDAKGTSLDVLPIVCFRLAAHKFTQMLFEPADAFCIHNSTGQLIHKSITRCVK